MQRLMTAVPFKKARPVIGHWRFFSMLYHLRRFGRTSGAMRIGFGDPALC